MPDNKHIVKYQSFSNRIIFPERIASGLLPDFAGAVKTWQARKREDSLTLDFGFVTKAYANGMLGIIAVTSELRRQGTIIRVKLPTNDVARNMFFSTSWAHLLNTELKNGYRQNNKHFARQFKSFEEIPPLINHFMDIIIGHIQMPKDVLAALEWSITEVCDNVINHAESKTGGFLQVIAYPQNNLVAFTVADAGKGILQSLKEGIPILETDLQALQEAIKAGVTRNTATGQGNGLAGTSRIAIMTGGTLDLLTGSGRLLLQQDGQTPTLNSPNQHFTGTCVSGQITMSHEFSVVDALTFGRNEYAPYTIVDVKYEKENEDALYIKASEQVEGAGTRAAGKEMRIKLKNLLNSKSNYQAYIDWLDVNIIASSFADEFLGKLFVEMGRTQFESTIKNINMTEVVEHVISKAISERSSTG